MLASSTSSTPSMVSGIARRAAGMNRTTRSISALTRRSHVGAGAATSISSSNNNSNTRSNIAKHNSVLNSPLRFFSNTNGKKKNKDNNTDIETLIPGLGNGGGGGGGFLRGNDFKNSYNGDEF